MSMKEMADLMSLWVTPSLVTVDLTVMHTSRTNARFSLNKLGPVGAGSAYLNWQKQTEQRSVLC